MGALIFWGVLGLATVMIYVVVGYLDPEAKRNNRPGE
jgi:hypothetical protein